MKYLEVDKFLFLNNELRGVDIGDRVIAGRLEAFSCKSVKADKKLYRKLDRVYNPEGASPLSSSPKKQKIVAACSSAQSLSKKEKTASISPHSFTTVPSKGADVYEAEKRLLPVVVTPPISDKSPTTVSGVKRPPAPDGVVLQPTLPTPQSTENLKVKISPKTPPTSPNKRARRSPVPPSPSNIGDLHREQTIHDLVDFIGIMNLVYPDFDFGDTLPNEFNIESNEQGVEKKINKHLMAVIDEKGESLMNHVWNAIDEVAGGLKKCEIYKYEGDSDIFVGDVWHESYFFYNRDLKKIVYFSLSERSKLHPEQSPDLESYPDTENEVPELSLDEPNQL